MLELQGAKKAIICFIFWGSQSEKVLTSEMIEKIVKEVEKKASELENKKMIPLKTIEDLINKHSLLEKELSSGSIDKKNFAEKSKEYSDLNEIVNNAKKYISYENDKTELQKILEDKNVMMNLEKWQKLN